MKTERYLVSIKKDCLVALVTRALIESCGLGREANICLKYFPELGKGAHVKGSNSTNEYLRILDLSDTDAVYFKMKYADLGFIFEQIISQD